MLNERCWPLFGLPDLGQPRGWQSHLFGLSTMCHDTIIEIDAGLTSSHLPYLKTGLGFVGDVKPFAVTLWGQKDVVTGLQVNRLSEGGFQCDRRDPAHQLTRAEILEPDFR